MRVQPKILTHFQFSKFEYTLYKYWFKKFYSISYKIVEIFLQAAVRQAMADQVGPQLCVNLISLHRIKKQMQVWIVFDVRAKNAPHF